MTTKAEQLVVCDQKDCPDYFNGHPDQGSCYHSKAHGRHEQCGGVCEPEFDAKCIPVEDKEGGR